MFLDKPEFLQEFFANRGIEVGVEVVPRHQMRRGELPTIRIVGSKPIPKHIIEQVNCVKGSIELVWLVPDTYCQMSPKHTDFEMRRVMEHLRSVPTVLESMREHRSKCSKWRYRMIQAEEGPEFKCDFCGHIVKATWHEMFNLRDLLASHDTQRIFLKILRASTPGL